MSVWANLEVIEDSRFTGLVTHTFQIPSREITLTNDSATKTLQFRFSGGGTFASLGPTETVTMLMWVKQITLKAESQLGYRLWIKG